MRFLILLLLTMAALSGCSRSTNPSTSSVSPSPQSREAQTEELRAKLKAMSVADGVSQSEAEVIAACYFHENVGCGAFTGIRDGGGFWIIDGTFGFAGKPIQGFHIDKATGKITSPIGPSYATPSKIFP